MSTDPSNPEIVNSVPTDTEAAAIVLALRDHGIDAQTTGGFTAGFRAESPGLVHVIVKASDLERAKTALEAIEREQPDIDWSNVDVGEPEG